MKLQRFLPNVQRNRSVSETFDNFLLEELHASAPFRMWLLGHLSHCLQIPAHNSVKVGKNPKREVASGQTDLSFVLCNEQGAEVTHILIENKVAGEFEDGQPERYAREVEGARARIGHGRAAAVLIAQRVIRQCSIIIALTPASGLKPLYTICEPDFRL